MHPYWYLDTNCISLVAKYARKLGYASLKSFFGSATVMVGTRNFQEMRIGEMQEEFLEFIRHIPTMMYNEEEAFHHEIVHFATGLENPKMLVPLSETAVQKTMADHEAELAVRDKRAKAQLLQGLSQNLKTVVQRGGTPIDVTEVVFEVVGQSLKERHLPQTHVLNINSKTCPIIFTFFSLIYINYINTNKQQVDPNDIVDLLNATCCTLVARYYTENHIADTLKKLKAFEPRSLYQTFKNPEKLVRYQPEKKEKWARFSKLIQDNKDTTRTTSRLITHTEIYRYADLKKQLDDFTGLHPSEVR